MVLLKTLLPIYPKNDKQNMVFLKISQNSQENAYAGVLFLNKFAGLQPALYLTKDSSTGAFL